MRISIPVIAIGSTIYRNIPDGYPLAVSLATNLRRLRRAANLTQIDLGARLGVGQAAVSRWEKGKTQPDAAMLPAIAVAVEGSLDQLLQGVEAQYDRTRDLPRHAGTGSSGSRQGEGSDDSASDRMELDELRTRVQEYETLVRQMQGITSRLFVLAARRKEGREARGAQSKSRGAVRKAG